MLRAYVLAFTLVLAACAASRSAPARSQSELLVDQQRAFAAYEAKQYDACARLFTEVAAHRRGRVKSSALYNAACCQARAGQLDAAFATLEHAITGPYDLANLEQEPDLASVRADPRSAALVAAIKQRFAAAERALIDPALRIELLALEVEHRAARKAVSDRPDDAQARADRDAVARKAIARLKQVAAKYTWPSKRIVGEDGAWAAWRLVMDSDRERAFQHQVLAAMAPLVERDDVNEVEWAQLYDLIAVAEHRPQRFGTQLDGHGEPHPIEDEANVDARRARVGLSSMAELKRSAATAR